MANIGDFPGLREDTINCLTDELQTLQENIRSIENVLKVLKRTDQMVIFEVLLQPQQEDTDKEAIRTISSRGLKQAIRQAHARFANMYDSKIVAPEYTVYLHFATQKNEIGKHGRIELPEKFYAHLKQNVRPVL